MEFSVEILTGAYSSVKQKTENPNGNATYHAQAAVRSEIHVKHRPHLIDVQVASAFNDASL